MSDPEEKDNTPLREKSIPPTASFNCSVPGPGSQIGQFRIERELGRGGMGVVYLAHDTKLNRPVAIKSLPAGVVDKREILSRWQHEARLLASLNHPNIATIHEVHEDADGRGYLVMEYIPGQTLAERLKNGPIPLNEAMSVFNQVAEGLEAAHHAGIIHRDLKPANIKITEDGRVKILDFGIAKEISDQALDEGSTITWSGGLIGTPGYMSPEQARGMSIDRRADVWAFGCCLYESLTGRYAFKGDTASDTLARILESEPDWSALPAKTPPRIRNIIWRCLQKDPRRRLRDIGEAWFEISETQSGASAPFARMDETASKHQFFRLHIILIGLACLIVGVLMAGVIFKSIIRPNPTVPPAVSRLSINLPADKRIFFGAGNPNCYLVISPDGKRLVYAGGSDTRNIRLYTRAIDDLEVEVISGTEGARNPFFSPDGQWVGFFTIHGEFKKVSLAGGEPLTLLEDLQWSTVLFGSWGKDGNIVFDGDSGLRRISDDGGTPEILIAPNTQKSPLWPRFPQILAEGNAVLYTYGVRIEVFLPGMSKRKTVLENATWARYVSSGHLVFLRGQVLMTAPFDVERLEVTGPASPVIDRIRMDSFRLVPQMAVSDNGALVYAPVTSRLGKSTLVWADRQGQTEVLDDIPRDYGTGLIRLSPDGRLVATQVIAQGSEPQVHIFDISRRMLTQLTTEGTNTHPEWSPDGKRLAFLSWMNAVPGLYCQAVDGSTPAELLVTGDYFPCSWSSDGKSLACLRQDPNTTDDIWIVPLEGDRKPLPYLTTGSWEDNPRFSPDGRWIAYASSESGKYEVYIRQYPDKGRKIQISTDGGTCPVWDPNGSELFYSDGANMMAVEITPQPDFSVGKPHALFDISSFDMGGNFGPGYDISGDGRRFIMLRRSELPEVQLVVVQNWFEELR